MIYLFLLIYILFLVYAIDLKKYALNKNLHWALLFFLFVVVCGLRYKIGGDTLGYMRSWDYYPALFQSYGVKSPIEVKMCNSEFERFQLGWITFSMLFKNISRSFFVFQFALSLILNIAVFRTIKKYSEYPFLTLLIFYFNFNFIELEFEVLRESLAVSVFLLFAFDYYVRKKWVRYFVGVVLAYFIHPSVAMMFLLPLFRYVKWPIQKCLLYVIPLTFFFSIGGRFLIGDIVNIALNGQEYMTGYVSRAVDMEFNNNYLIMYAFRPTLMAVLVLMGYRWIGSKIFSPLIVLTIVFLYFSMLYFTASRLANYIIIPVYISLAPIFLHYMKRLKTIWITISLLLLYLVPFLFALRIPETRALYFPYQNILFI